MRIPSKPKEAPLPLPDPFRAALPGVIRAAILGAFTADALALGVHWVYETDAIVERFGRIDDLHAPGLVEFHAHKRRGDFTHGGDQAYVLLESLAEKGRFDAADFLARWNALFDAGETYVDAATQTTREQLTQGAPLDEAASTSDELMGAARLVPLLARYHNDPERCVDAARTACALTHFHPTVIESAEFFLRLTLNVAGGNDPLAALISARNCLDPEGESAALIQKGLDTRHDDTVSAIAGLGQGCPIGMSLPATVHLIARYESDFKEALIQNAMAGGDSSARGLLTGMVLGARWGLDAIPESWLRGLTRYDALQTLLARF